MTKTRPTDQARAELRLINPDFRHVAHLLADCVDAIEARIADIERALPKPPPTNQAPADYAGDPTAAAMTFVVTTPAADLC
jgi:hypothetical protein